MAYKHRESRQAGEERIMPETKKEGRNSEFINQFLNRLQKEDQKREKPSEEVVVKTAQPVIQTAPPAKVQPPVTKITFLENNSYVLMLGLAVIILTAIVIFGFAVVIVQMRK